MRLHEIEAVKFGEFKLMSGIMSPIYVDLRVIVSYPDVLTSVAECMWDVLSANGATFDNMCGVPYTALPFATGMSLASGRPMIMRRKEAKDYGTKKMIRMTPLNTSSTPLRSRFSFRVNSGGSVPVLLGIASAADA